MVSLKSEFKLREGPRGMIYRVDKYLTQISPDVFSTKPGLLVCAKHSKAWCSDVQKAVSENRDAFSIPRDIESDSVYWLQVPVSPTQGIYANVFLDRVQSHNGLKNMFSVYLNPPRDGVAENKYAHMTDEHGFNLGILCQGEGRLAIRGMIIEWLTLQWLSGEYGKCSSFTHSAKDRIRLGELLQKRATALPEVFNLIWYDKCTKCLIETGPGYNFDADLIPPR